jgi:hypothetical protein
MYLSTGSLGIGKMIVQSLGFNMPNAGPNMEETRGF